MSILELAELYESLKHVFPLTNEARPLGETVPVIVVMYERTFIKVKTVKTFAKSKWEMKGWKVRFRTLVRMTL